MGRRWVQNGGLTCHGPSTDCKLGEMVHTHTFCLIWGCGWGWGTRPGQQELWVQRSAQCRICVEAILARWGSHQKKCVEAWIFTVRMHPPYIQHESPTKKIQHDPAIEKPHWQEIQVVKILFSRALVEKKSFREITLRKVK